MNDPSSGKWMRIGQVMGAMSRTMDVLDSGKHLPEAPLSKILNHELGAGILLHVGGKK
jgi:hypothetical protein